MLITVSKEDVATIPKGGARCLSGIDESKKVVPIIVHRGLDGLSFRACLNKCSHMGARFAPDIEDFGSLKCVMHGWKLDPASMTYDAKTCPDGAVPGQQPELEVSKNADGSLTLKVGEACCIA
jgi:nitrite reductase/ring-hydroxylating ferredoxin subunit